MLLRRRRQEIEGSFSVVMVEDVGVRVVEGSNPLAPTNSSSSTAIPNGAGS
jgi:hypothetical protein